MILGGPFAARFGSQMYHCACKLQPAERHPDRVAVGVHRSAAPGADNGTTTDTTDAWPRAGCRLRQSCPPGSSAIAKPPGGTVIASFAPVATSTSRDSSSKSPRLS